jgi:hypothetical protein
MDIETSQRTYEKNITNNEPTHQEESWKMVTSSKKRKITTNINARRTPGKIN